MNAEALKDMLGAWNDPQMRHAMIVHIPIAMSMLAAVAAILLAIRPRNAWLRAIAIIAAALLAGSAWLASDSGKAAEHDIDRALSAAAAEALDQHEDMGAIVWFLAACGLGVLLLTLIPQKGVQRISALAAALGMLFVLMWTATTAHYGGTLVYEHGVGAPAVVGDAAISDPNRNSGPSVPDDLAATDPHLAHFVQVVRPILEANCWGCHNPGRAQRNGGLDLTSREAMLAGGDSEVAVIQPGDPDQSLLIQAVRYDDPFLQMPPPRKGQLPKDAVAAFEKWVLEGAVWHGGPPLPADIQSPDGDDEDPLIDGGDGS